MTDEQEKPNPPSLHVIYEGAEIKITVENVSPAQIWATCHMLEMFADDMYRNQMVPQPQSGLTVARTLDHLQKARPRQ